MTWKRGQGRRKGLWRQCGVLKQGRADERWHPPPSDSEARTRCLVSALVESHGMSWWSAGRLMFCSETALELSVGASLARGMVECERVEADG